MDYCYNHPVLHVFSHVLENTVHSQRGGRKDDEGNMELLDADELEKKNKRGWYGVNAFNVDPLNVALYPSIPTTYKVYLYYEVPRRLA
jgi:hypothetical protein